MFMLQGTITYTDLPSIIKDPVRLITWCPDLYQVPTLQTLVILSLERSRIEPEITDISSTSAERLLQSAGHVRVWSNTHL